VSIEAKADEPFGQEIVGEYFEKMTGCPESHVPERITLLLKGVLGVGPDNEDARTLRHQLLTAVAGAMKDAQEYGAETVMVIVHEFIGATDPNKVRGNADDLNNFVRLLSRGRIEAIIPGEIAGPFEAPGNEHFTGTNGPLIGKARRNE